jgi:hypothetical protein
MYFVFLVFSKILKVVLISIQREILLFDKDNHSNFKIIYEYVHNNVISEFKNCYDKRVLYCQNCKNKSHSFVYY